MYVVKYNCNDCSYFADNTLLFHYEDNPVNDVSYGNNCSAFNARKQQKSTYIAWARSRVYEL